MEAHRNPTGESTDVIEQLLRELLLVFVYLNREKIYQRRGRRKSGRDRELKNRTGERIVEITAKEIEADADSGSGES